MSDAFSTHGHSRSRGGRPDPLYKMWGSMRERCNNPSHAFFKNYGGKGISVCAEWSDYEAFRAWALANGWEDRQGVPRGDRLSIDRIDSSMGYSPGNCRLIPQRINASRNPAKAVSHLH